MEILLSDGSLIRGSAAENSDLFYGFPNSYGTLGYYYRSIQRKSEDWLTSKDYIWRWDTDWFWCSKQFHAQNPLVRLLATKRLLNSRTYQRAMRLSQRFRGASQGTESVIEDVDIPIHRAVEFLRFLQTAIRISPIWVCPFRALEAQI